MYLGAAGLLAAYRLLTDPAGFLRVIVWLALVGCAVVVYWRAKRIS